MLCYLQSIDWHVRPISQLLHPPGAGFQRPHEPPTPRGQVAAPVVAGVEAVTVTVRVLVLVVLEEEAVHVTVTTTIDVEVDGGVTVTVTTVTVSIFNALVIHPRF